MGSAGWPPPAGSSTRRCDVTVIDANNYHTFQPLLYQVATAGLDADDIGYAIRGMFRGQRNAEVRMGRVTGVDLTDGRHHRRLG